MAWSGAWKHLIESANWIRQRLRVHDARLRCDACRAEFIPGPAGAATFIDELNSIRLIVCSLCESRLLLRGAPALRQRSREAREVADSSINRAQDAVHRTIQLAGDDALGPAPAPAQAPVPETETAPINKDE